MYEWRDNGRWRSKLLQKGEFCLQSHRDINIPRWHNNFEFLAIALEPAFVERSFQDTNIVSNACFIEKRAEFDPVIAEEAKRFQAELVSGSYAGALYGESVALAFAAYLLEQHSNLPKKLSRARGKLSSLQLREIVEYIHTNLAFHFARLFKHSFGLSPHQYILQNRIERAKKLITADAGCSLTDIALQVGFYDQTHFGKAFKRTVGVSPKVFIKESKNLLF